MKKILIMFLILLSIQSCKQSDPVIQYVSALNGLVLREEPGVKGNLIAIIPFRSKIEIVEKSEKTELIDGLTDPWCKVRWNNYEGWVFQGYVKPLAHYNKNILLYNHISTDSFIKDDYTGPESSVKLAQVFTKYFKALPDILIDNEVIIVDTNNIYTDYINNIYAEFYASGWIVSFDLKSGKKFNPQYVGGPLFIRKSYYKTISQKLPVIRKLDIVSNTNIEDIFYKEILNFKGDNFHFGHEFGKKEINEINIKTELNVKAYNISQSIQNSFMILFEETKNSNYSYYCFIDKGHIVKAHGGRFICAFTAGKALYLFFDSWEPDTGYGGKMLYKYEDGEIELIEKDFTYAV